MKLRTCRDKAIVAKNDTLLEGGGRGVSAEDRKFHPSSREKNIMDSLGVVD